MKKKGKMFMAIDQYGICFHGLKNPRKELMELVGIKRASKMYVEGSGRKNVHIGYVVGKRWFTLYEVIPYRGEK